MVSRVFQEVAKRMKRSSLTKILKLFLYSSGMISLARLCRSNGTCIPVLRYHSVSKGVDYCPQSISVGKELFERQIKYIAKHYSVITLDKVVDCLQRQVSFPKRALAITFDDGYLDNYTDAYRILAKYRLPATFFVTADPVVGGKPFWVGWLQRGISRLPDLSALMNLFGVKEQKRLDVKGKKKALIETISVEINNSSLEGKSDILHRLEGVFDSFLKDRMDSNFMLRPEHLQEMLAAGMQIGSHTMTHPILSSLSDDQVLEELLESKRILESICGSPIRHFAFPNGPGVKNFDNRVSRLVEKAGYVSASTSERGIVTLASNRFAMERQGINHELSIGPFAFKLEEHNFKYLLLPVQ